MGTDGEWREGRRPGRGTAVHRLGGGRGGLRGLLVRNNRVARRADLVDRADAGYDKTGDATRTSILVLLYYYSIRPPC